MPSISLDVDENGIVAPYLIHFRDPAEVRFENYFPLRWSNVILTVSLGKSG